MVVNNWFIIVDGMVAVSARWPRAAMTILQVTSEWSKLYFVAFWLIGVVFFFNLVIGFVLDVFHTEYVAKREVD